MAAIVLSYGHLPTKRQFQQQYAKEVGAFDDDNYYLDLKGEDDGAVSRLTGAGAKVYNGPGDYTGEEVWRLIGSLTRAHNNKGDEEAGSLASAMLDTVGIEWV